MQYEYSTQQQVYMAKNRGISVRFFMYLENSHDTDVIHSNYLQK